MRGSFAERDQSPIRGPDEERLLHLSIPKRPVDRIGDGAHGGAWKRSARAVPGQVHDHKSVALPKRRSDAIPDVLVLAEPVDQNDRGLAAPSLREGERGLSRARRAGKEGREREQEGTNRCRARNAIHGRAMFRRWSPCTPAWSVGMRRIDCTFTC